MALTEATRLPQVVVLGATGFVGSGVLRELAQRPVRIRAVARHPAVVPGDARADIEVLTADLTEAGAMAVAVADADVVIHTVAYIAGSSTWRIEDGDSAAERVNVGLVRDLIDVLRAKKRGATPTSVLFAGAASQVGPAMKEVLDGSEPDAPKGEYDRQKLAAEQLVMAATADGLIRGTSVRLPTIYGQGPDSTAADKGVISTMARRALAGEPLTMWHDGTIRRDLLYIDDAARALVAALDHQPALAGRHWVLGTGRGEPLGEVFRAIAELAATRSGKPKVPVVTVQPPAHAEVSDFRSVVIDSSAFRQVTGWRPQVPLSVGLHRTVAALAESSGD